MATQKSPGYVRIDRARIYSIDAFTPASLGEGKADLYRVTAIIEGEDPDFEKMRKATLGTLSNIYTASIASRDIADPYFATMPGESFLDGRGNPIKAAAGGIVIRAASRKQPLLLNAKNEQLTEDTGLIYPGCYARLILDLFPVVTGTMRHGIYADWLGLRFQGDGKPFRRGPARKATQVTESMFDDEEDDWVEQQMRDAGVSPDFPMQ